MPNNDKIQINTDDFISPERKSSLKRNLQITFAFWFVFGVIQLAWHQEGMHRTTMDILLITNIIYVCLPFLGFFIVRNESVHVFEYVFGTMIFEFIGSNLILLIDAFKHGFWASTLVAIIVDVFFTILGILWGLPWFRFITAKGRLIERAEEERAKQKNMEQQ